jgi:hypothetical protein
MARWRVIWRVRIVVVHPEEHGAVARDRSDPAERPISRRLGAAVEPLVQWDAVELARVRRTHRREETRRRSVRSPARSRIAAQAGTRSRWHPRRTLPSPASSASVAVSGPRLHPLRSTPCVRGWVPVRNVACEGAVLGVACRPRRRMPPPGPRPPGAGSSREDSRERSSGRRASCRGSRGRRPAAPAAFSGAVRCARSQPRAASTTRATSSPATTRIAGGLQGALYPSRCRSPSREKTLPRRPRRR